MCINVTGRRLIPADRPPRDVANLQHGAPGPARLEVIGVDSISELIEHFCDLIDATDFNATDEQWEALLAHDAVLYAACQRKGIKIPTTPPSMASTASGELRQMRQMGCTGLPYIRTLVGHRIVVTSEWQQTIRQLRAVLEAKQRKPRKSTGGKPRVEARVPKGKVLLGQALQFDWLTYIAQGNPNDENEAYHDWRVEHGLSGDFDVAPPKAKDFRRWFASTHTKAGRHPDDAVSLEAGFKLSDDDSRAIANWLKSQ